MQASEKPLNRGPMVYMTVLSNAAYLPGVRGLKKSMQKAGCRRDLVVLVPEDKERELRPALEKAKILDNRCRILVKPPVVLPKVEGISFEENYWTNTFFKLRVADCTEFSKLILLDSDMLVLHNLDSLFDKPHYSAVVGGQSATPVWEDLNSGMMVLEPSRSLYNHLLDSIAPAMKICFDAGNNIGDQDVFKAAFPDWREHNELKLPEKYNSFFHETDDILRNRGYQPSDIAVIHFVGAKKPWSNGIFSKRNIGLCGYLLLHRKFWQVKMYIRYTLYSLLK